MRGVTLGKVAEDNGNIAEVFEFLIGVERPHDTPDRLIKPHHQVFDYSWMLLTIGRSALPGSRSGVHL
jgi:hypothetical protein